jgi:cellulose synthase/poly-beta-1,6-N-acetylglucosamine synthase-like glycosyltransferase
LEPITSAFSTAQIDWPTIPTGCPTHFASNTISLIIGRANWLFFWYYAGSTVSYITLMILAYLYGHRHDDKVRARDLGVLRLSLPRVTIIAPAKNEQACILGAAQSFLSMDYPNLEVLFVDDESTDLTFELLQTAYQLRLDESPIVSTLPHRPILSVWRSANDSRLVVVRKLSAGFKGDATNAGLEIASGEYALVTDTDSLLEKEAALRMMCVVLEDPATVAVGGNLHAVNGCDVSNGQLRAIHSPCRYFEIAQVVEYARAFFMSRLGWSFLDMTPNISGALGLFRIDVLRAVGGYANVLAEDMDMTFKVHRHILGNNLPNRIRFAPDAKAWTEVPPDYRYVASQRARWHNSLCDVLWRFRSMLFRPRYGLIGFVLLPWFWIYELIAPVVEGIAWISIGLAAILGCLNWTLAPIIIGGGYGLTILLSVLSILQSERRYPRYTEPDKMKLIFRAVLEVFPFRFLHIFWRLRGQVDYFRGDQRWQAIPRVGFEHAEHGKGGD